MVLLLAQQAESVNARFAEALTLMGVGMAVVFTALLLLWLVIAIVDRATHRTEQTKTKTDGGVAASGSPSDASPSTDDPQLIAVLTAAATAALGQRVRLRRVHFLGDEDPSWSREGRRLVMTSHRPHLHKR
jgi:sodium pump decarboxylase gamma subunit